MFVLLVQGLCQGKNIASPNQQLKNSIKQWENPKILLLQRPHSVTLNDLFSTFPGSMFQCVIKPLLHMKFY